MRRQLSSGRVQPTVLATVPIRRIGALATFICMLALLSCSGGAGNRALAAPKLDWVNCGAGRECATLIAPLDYAHADQGATVRIAVLRVAATKPAERIGSLIINPGGPGGSGVDFARRADAVFSDDVRAHFDIVGFDPRGVGESFPPIVCDSAAPAPTSIISTPDHRTTIQRRSDAASTYADSCEHGTGAELAFVDTATAARDIERLRLALDQPRISYFGYSYGTLLGATYADLYPQHVRAFVLDGAEDPTLTYEQKYKARSDALEQELQAYLADCATRIGCSFYSKGFPAQEFDRLLRNLDVDPLSLAANDGRQHEIGPAAVLAAVENALGTSNSWPMLSQALADADVRHDATALAALAGSSPGPSSLNAVNANRAIVCLDESVPQDDAEYQRLADLWGREDKHFGARWAYVGYQCSHWPVPPKATPEALHAVGSSPILVVGTKGDPVTPHAWAVSLAHQLESGRLLTWTGHGHTAYGKKSTCVDAAVDRYLIEADAPESANCD